MKLTKEDKLAIIDRVIVKISIRHLYNINGANKTNPYVNIRKGLFICNQLSQILEQYDMSANKLGDIFPELYNKLYEYSIGISRCSFPKGNKVFTNSYDYRSRITLLLELEQQLQNEVDNEVY